MYWRRTWQPTPVFLPGEAKGQGSLVGFSLWGRTWLKRLNSSSSSRRLILEKAKEPEIKFPTSVGSSKKQESSWKTYTSASLTTPKPLTVWMTTNCGKFLKRWEYQTTLPAPWEMFMQVKKQPLELDIEQWTGSKLGKEYIKAVYCHPASLTYMQSTSCKMPGWMKHKLESWFPGEISIALDPQMIPVLW